MEQPLDPPAALPTAEPYPSAEPQPPGHQPIPNLPALRHDAFTGELMARFCEVLAETGIVTDACRAVGKDRDTAYRHRRRNPLFAAAWAAALSHARNRLADALLARSLEGSVDFLYRDGELVGERRYIDNRVAYAMLRRLDKQAEADPEPVRTELARQPAKALRRLDWDLALTALRTGSQEDLCAALASIDGDASPPAKAKSGESDNPPDADGQPAGFMPESPFGSDRVWEEEHGVWWTNFPPPSGFDGEERGRWDDAHYQRECTDAEGDLLAAGREASFAGYRAEEEAERDLFFGSLREQLEQGTEAP